MERFKNKNAIGTHSYMAPEIFPKIIYSKTSDVYWIIEGSISFENLLIEQFMYIVALQKEQPEFINPISKIYKDLIEHSSFEENVHWIKKWRWIYNRRCW